MNHESQVVGYSGSHCVWAAVPMTHVKVEPTGQFLNECSDYLNKVLGLKSSLNTNRTREKQNDADMSPVFNSLGT